MARIKVENITKTFGKTVALKNVSLEVEDGEFLVLFGPAGAGKTTLLNMIAGIDDPDSGSIWFNEKAMNFVEAQKRNVSMVFENYALYPQMSVYDNIASPLRSRQFRETEDVIREKVAKVAETTGMTEYLERKPSQLSNGQKQRVALCRALIRDPNVFLLDEPIAHLDAKLRNAMRKELKLMQKEMNCTSIYVTHDFTEAMSLGDRIAVIREGEIVQIGENAEVYYKPVDEFVAKLFGDCEINIIPAEIRQEDGKKFVVIESYGLRYEVPEDVGEKLGDTVEVDLGCRTPAIICSKEPVDGFVKGSVYTVEPLGNKTELVILLGEDLIRFIVPVTQRYDIDETVYIGLDLDNAIFFDHATQLYITHHNEDELLEV